MTSFRMPGNGLITAGINMKAYLLAAGLGTRLRPVTETTPKCLVPINGRPLLDYWMDLFNKYGVTDVLVNTHYLADQVSAYISNHNECGGPHITEFYEPELLGSGGTVAANKDFVLGEESFFICYADNLTNINLGRMKQFHYEHNSSFTMALFRAPNPSQCGIAELDKNSRIIDFVEKPAQPKSDLSNAGVYLANQSLFDYLPQGQFCDFGNDVIPKLIGKMYGLEIDDYLLDVGTLEKYEKAQLDVKNKIVEF